MSENQRTSGFRPFNETEFCDLISLIVQGFTFSKMSKLFSLILNCARLGQTQLVSSDPLEILLRIIHIDFMLYKQISDLYSAIVNLQGCRPR